MVVEVVQEVVGVVVEEEVLGAAIFLEDLEQTLMFLSCDGI